MLRVPSFKIHGKNLTKNEYIGMGVYHTLQIDDSTSFKVSKMVWNDKTLHHLKEFPKARNPKVVSGKIKIYKVFKIG